MYQTDMVESLLAETVTYQGYRNETINAYFARPLGPGPFAGVVLVHHMPGWDMWYKQAALRFAYLGYAVLCPNLYYRVGHGTPEDVAAKARAAGGVPDDQVVGDLTAAANFLRGLPTTNGKLGMFGTCSGGRHAFLTACQSPVFDAVVDCWGGRVVMRDDELTAYQPVAPVVYTEKLQSPLLGLFGEEDQNPTPEHVAVLEQALKKYGKTYDFHIYPNAGHGFFYEHRPSYRQEQAVDGWNRVYAFFEKYLRP